MCWSPEFVITRSNANVASSSSVLQAMDMISIAQSTGDISADIYRQKSAKPIATPQLAGLEKHNQKLQEEMQAAQNPFQYGTSTSTATVPNGQSPMHFHASQTAPCKSSCFLLLLVLSSFCCLCMLIVAM